MRAGGSLPSLLSGTGAHRATWSVVQVKTRAGSATARHRCSAVGPGPRHGLPDLRPGLSKKGAVWGVARAPRAPSRGQFTLPGAPRRSRPTVSSPCRGQDFSRAD